jgi:predicted NAD/FAD-binding protein
MRLGKAVESVVRGNEGVRVDGEGFDYVVMSCDASTARQVLGADTSLLERFVLGNVRYYDDVTVTHTDADYMRTHFDASPSRPDVYLMRMYAHDATLCEMGLVGIGSSCVSCVW